MHWAKWFRLLPVWLPVLVAGCGVTVDGRRVIKDDAAYRIGVLGPGWERGRVGDEDVSWYNAEYGATILVNATCERYEDARLTTLTRHLSFGMTDVVEHDRQTIELDGREALRTRLDAKLDGVPIGLLAVVLKKDACIFDFDLSASPEKIDEAVPDFDAFVSGFAYHPGAGD